MPRQNPQLGRLSISQLSDLTGFAPRTISRRLAEAGVEPVERDGSAIFYRPRVALPALFLQGAVDPMRERALLDQVKRQIEEIKLAELRGEVVRAGEVEAALVTVTSAIQVRILSVPAATAQELAASSEPAECQAITSKALHGALGDLASARVVRATPRRRGGPPKAAQGEGDAETEAV